MYIRELKRIQALPSNHNLEQLRVIQSAVENGCNVFGFPHGTRNPGGLSQVILEDKSVESGLFFTRPKGWFYSDIFDRKRVP